MKKRACLIFTILILIFSTVFISCSDENNPAETGDTTSPDISITSPVNGASYALGDTVWVNCTASDNVGVSKVELIIDGTYAATSYDSISKFWYLPSTAGSHTVKLKAYDAEMNIGESSVVTITAVQDSSPPFVSITSPSDNSGFVVGNNIEIICYANDNLRIKKVELYLNGSFFAADASLPYSFTWNTESIATGKYTLKAIAYDGAGNSGESSEISVFIESGEPLQLSGLEPNGGQVWKHDTVQNITWSDNFSSDVVIELYKNEYYYMTIDYLAPSSGTYSWTVPSYITPDSDYKIKITHLYDLSVFDYSDNYMCLCGTSREDALGIWKLSSGWSKAVSSIEFKTDGTFVTGDASSGTWTLDGDGLKFTFTDGTYYIGNINGDMMDGTMKDPAGATGTWDAQRIVTLSYDDGIPEISLFWNTYGELLVRFTMPDAWASGTIESFDYYITADPVEVTLTKWSSFLNNNVYWPNTRSFLGTITIGGTGWRTVDLSANNIAIPSREFFVGFRSSVVGKPSIGGDTTSLKSRSYTTDESLETSYLITDYNFMFNITIRQTSKDGVKIGEPVTLGYTDTASGISADVLKLPSIDIRSTNIQERK